VKAMKGAKRVKRKASSDMWSVGVMAYEMFTDSRVFDESMSEEEVAAILCSVSGADSTSRITCRCSVCG
jgi:serine/threonine protein kinase